MFAQLFQVGIPVMAEPLAKKGDLGKVSLSDDSMMVVQIMICKSLEVM